MALLSSIFETFHGGPLHAVSFDLYGTKVATASSDESIRLWDVSGESGTAQFVQELRGHSGPVWQVCWAHPRYGQVLGSCGYDRRVVVWQQQGKGQGFAPVYSNEDHGASVNTLAFAPEGAGLVLAAGSSDGSISILSHREGTAQDWSRQAFSAHFNGVLAVAWAPIGGLAGGAPKESPLAGLLLASGGGDNRVRLWAVDASQQWSELPPMEGQGHSDWVRDVAFRPQGASSFVVPGALLLASCSEDKTVKLWIGEPPSQQQQQQQQEETALCPAPSEYKWRLLQTLCFEAPAWRVSWSSSGALLAVACGDSAVLLLKENVHGSWELVTDLAEKAALEQQQHQQQQQQQQMPVQMNMQQQQQQQQQPMQQQQQQPMMQQHSVPQQPLMHQQQPFQQQQPLQQQQSLQQQPLQHQPLQQAPPPSHAFGSSQPQQAPPPLSQMGSGGPPPPLRGVQPPMPGAPPTGAPPLGPSSSLGAVRPPPLPGTQQQPQQPSALLQQQPQLHASQPGGAFGAPPPMQQQMQQQQQPQQLGGRTPMPPLNPVSGGPLPAGGMVGGGPPPPLPSMGTAGAPSQPFGVAPTPALGRPATFGAPPPQPMGAPSPFPQQGAGAMGAPGAPMPPPMGPPMGRAAY
ncbi:hypothetical protein Emag_007108 [Eimeria magna]